MTYIEQVVSIALSNKYTKWYCSIIERAQVRANTKKMANKLLGYTEGHHILPKSFKMGGEKDKLNLAYLTAREHLVCHLLLSRMFTGQLKVKMCFGLHSMYRIMKRNTQIKLTSWEYSKLREANSYARQLSTGTFTGRTHKASSKELMSKQATGRPGSAGQKLAVSKPVEINGTIYPSAAEAARQLGIKKITLQKRLLSSTEQFSGYKYVGIEKSLNPRHNNVIINGVLYPNARQASITLNIKYGVMLHRLSSTTFKNYTVVKGSRLEMLEA